MFENFKVPKELMPSDPRFGVGPSLVPVEFLQRLAETGTKLLGTSHRKSAVKNLVKEVQDGIRQYFQLPAGYEVVLGNGGATLLFDMIGLGLVEKSSLHYVTGEFSDKWYKSHKQIPWISATAVKMEFGQGVNPRPEAGHDMICCTLNETSTGVMVTETPSMGSDVLLAVDATSGAGQIKVDFKNVDLYFFSPQKVFASEGGLFVAILSPKALARAEKLAQDKSRYVPEIMRWSLAIDNSKQNQTYNTPSISTLFFINEQLKLMNALGEEKVLAEARRKAELLYGWAESKPYLKPYIQDARFRSQAVATIDVDDKFKTEDLSKVLRSQHAAYDIDSYRKLGRNQFRIGMFHNVSYNDLEKLTRIISLAIESEK
jgi:phosphoserine aminotransferase